MHNLICFLILVGSLFRISEPAFCDYRIITTNPSDVVLTASSEFGAPIATQIHDASRGVLNYTQFTTADGKTYHGAWSAAINDQNQYIQIQLKNSYKITGVITQGRNGCCQQWVTQYRVQYGSDCSHLKFVDSGNGTMFKGNTDEDTMVTNMIPIPITAKCVRIRPTDFHNQISMRVDIIGCKDQTTVTTTPVPNTSSSTSSHTTSPTKPTITQTFLPGSCGSNLIAGNSNVTSTVTASSTKDKGSMLVTYDPKLAYLFSKEDTNHTHQGYMGGWSPDKADANPFIQVEFSDPTVVRGIVTQGKNGCCDKWVKRYKVFYSTDCKTWTPSGGGTGQIFTGNADKDTPKTQILFCPEAVKCVRIQPIDWNNEIGMRFEIIGCKIIKGGIPGSNVTSSTMNGSASTTQSTTQSTTMSTTPHHAKVTHSGSSCNQSLFAHLPYQSGNIVMSASSEKLQQDPAQDYSADRGRLHSTETLGVNAQLHGGWSAANLDTNQFIQVQLPHLSTISGIVTQGKDGLGKEWVTKYRVLYSDDCKQWHVINPVGGGGFKGNSDESTEVLNMFSRQVKALCVKINPSVWNNHISLRMDLLGCFGTNNQTSPGTTVAVPSTLAFRNPTIATQSVNTNTNQQAKLCQNSLINNITLGKEVNLTATSSFHNPTVQTMPERALLDTKKDLSQLGTLLGGWSPTGSGQQYIQASFSSVQMIENVITQGMDQSQQWVTKFSIVYSEDCVNWQQLRNPKEFTANSDDHTKVNNKLGCPIFAKCIRIYPTASNNQTGLRFDLIGCNIKDSHKNSQMAVTTSSSTSSSSTTRSTAATTLTSKSSSPTFATMSATTSVQSSMLSSTTISLQASVSTQISTPSTSAKTSMLPSTTKLLQSSIPTILQTHSKTITTPISSATKPMQSSVLTVLPTSSIAMTASISSSANPSTSPSTTATSTPVSTTTTKPTTHITHHVLPTGLASIYNTKDPVDCKRALLMFSCSNPIVRRHCFNSCNPKQGVSSVVSSTATSSVQFSSSSKPVVSSTASSIASLAPSSSVMFTVSSGVQSSKTISLASSIPTQLLLSLAMVSSSGLSPSHVKTSSLPLSTNTPSSNTVMHSSQYIQPSSSHPATSAPPSSNAIMPSSLPSMTTSSAIVTTPVQHTHVVLPTGQATIYNPLDPLDCKRSLLMFSCNLSIIAKHCHHSCTKPSSSVSIISSNISLASSSSNVMSASTVKSSNGISSSVLSSNMKSSQISAATTNSVVQSSSQTLSIKASSRVQLPSSMAGSSAHITSSIAPMSSSVTSSSANVLSSIASLQNSSPSLFVNTQTNVLLSSSSLQQPLSLSSSSMSSNMPSSSLNLQTSLQISLSSSVVSQTILSSQSQQNSASTQQYSTPLSNLNMHSSNSVLPSNTQLISTAMPSSLQSSGSSILISSSAGSVVSMSSSNIPKQNLNSASSSIPSSVASILSSVNGFSSMMPSSSISVGSSLLPTQNLNSVPSSAPASVASISSSASGFSLMSSSSMIAVGSSLLPTQTLNSVSSVIPSTVASIKSSRRMSFSSSVSSVSSVQSSPLSMSHSSLNSQQSTASLSSSQPVGSSFVMSSNFQTSVPSLSTIQHTASPLLTGMNLPSTSNLNSGIVSSTFSSSSSSQGFSMQSGFSSGINTSPIPTNSAIPSSGMPIPSSFMYTSHSSNGPSSQSVVSMLNSVTSNIPTPTTSSSTAHSFSTSPYLSSSPISSVKTSMASSTTSPATSSYHNSLLSMPSYYTPTPSVTNSPPLSTSLQSQQSLLSSSIPTNSLLSSNFVTSGISSSSSNLMAQSSSASIHSSMLVSSSSISTSYSQPLSLYSTDQPSLSSVSGAFNTAMPSFTPAYTSTMPMVSSALSSVSVSLSVSCTLVTSMIMFPYSSSSLFTDSSLLPSVPSAISTSIFPTSIGTGYLLPSSSLPNGFSMSMIGSSQIISTSCQTVTVSPASSASNLNSNSVYSVVPSLSTSSLYSAVPVSQSGSTFVSSILPTTQVTAMHTSMIPSQSPPTTVIPPPHVAIPTGVASFYDSRDPVDCKRALQMASCTISVVSKHCPFSCASHPASPVTFSRSPPTGSSAGTKSQNVFFSSSPNSSYQNTNSTGPSTSLNLPSSTQRPSITVYPSTRKSWYDPRDPKQCEQLITWVSCSDFYYGSMCQYSCVNKRLALG